MKRDAIDLGKAEIPVLFRKYLLPTLFGMLSLCAVTATDGIFVGRGVGSDALAAVNICIAPTMVMMGIGLRVDTSGQRQREGCPAQHHPGDGCGHHCRAVVHRLDPLVP